MPHPVLPLLLAASSAVALAPLLGVGEWGMGEAAALSFAGFLASLLGMGRGAGFHEPLAVHAGGFAASQALVWADLFSPAQGVLFCLVFGFPFGFLVLLSALRESVRARRLAPALLPSGEALLPVLVRVPGDEGAGMPAILRAAHDRMSLHPLPDGFPPRPEAATLPNPRPFSPRALVLPPGEPPAHPRIAGWGRDSHLSALNAALSDRSKRLLGLGEGGYSSWGRWHPGPWSHDAAALLSEDALLLDAARRDPEIGLRAAAVHPFRRALTAARHEALSGEDGTGCGGDAPLLFPHDFRAALDREALRRRFSLVPRRAVEALLNDPPERADPDPFVLAVQALAAMEWPGVPARTREAAVARMEPVLRRARAGSGVPRPVESWAALGAGPEDAEAWASLPHPGLGHPFWRLVEALDEEERADAVRRAGGVRLVLRAAEALGARWPSRSEALSLIEPKATPGDTP